MPNTRTVHDFAATIESIGTAAQRAQKDAVMRASMILKNSIESELMRATGGDGRLRNLRKKGGTPAKLGLGFNVRGVNNPTALLIARGPWGLVEYGAHQHRITPRLAKTGSGKGMSRRQRQLAIRQQELNQAFGARGTYAGKRPMPIARGVYRYSANHPGTKGKYPWKRGMDRARDRAVQELRTVIRSRVVDVIRSGRNTYTYVRGETGAQEPFIPGD